MMKKTNVMYVLVLMFIILVSCSKDDDEDQTWEKSLLIGKWEQTGGTNFTACPSGDNKWIEFTETKYIEAATDDAGCATVSTATMDYTFNGKVVDLGLATYAIKKLDETTLEASLTSFGVSGGTVIYTKMP